MGFSASQRSAQRVYLSVPHMGGTELKYVHDAFTANWLTTAGPNLGLLEAAFTREIGLPCVAVGSGTAALHLAIKLHGIKPGDEVVTPTLTFAASCNPILYEHGTPIFIDSDRATWNLDPNLLAEFLKHRADRNRLPKLVTVVHLFGQCADLDALCGICQRYEIPLCEDAAECLGAQYRGRIPGTFGSTGVFSFNGNKIITCTGGGMLVSPRAEWVEKARFWSTQARDPDPLGVGNYVHSEVGYNYRLSNVLAGIALGQLEVLEQRVQQRRAVFDRYRAAFQSLPGFEPQPEAEFGGPSDGPNPATSRHTRWLSCFLIDETRFGMSTTELIQFLASANVESRPVWRPMHLQKLYERCERIGGSIAEDLHGRGLCLPSSSSLSPDEQQFVIDRVWEAHGARRPAP